MKKLLCMLTAILPFAAQLALGQPPGGQTPGAQALATVVDAIVPAETKATYKVQVSEDENGMKYAKLDAQEVRGKTLTGKQYGIDQLNNYVEFNADENLGNPKLDEFIYRVVEGQTAQGGEVESIRDYIGMGPLFKPWEFMYEEQEAHVLRTRIEGTIKRELDRARIAELAQQVSTSPPPNVDPNTVDVNQWAEWIYFYQQLTSWEDYLSKDLFHQTLDVRSSYDPRLLTDELQSLPKSHRDQAEAISQMDVARVQSILDRLKKRDEVREQYRQWFLSREREIDEFVLNFMSRLSGTLLDVDGQMFLVTAKPETHLPYRSINVVTDVVTPYDLLDDSGQVKKYQDYTVQSKFN